MSRQQQALVVFESMFGNTEQVADAVARGLRSGGVEVHVVDVGSAHDSLPEDVGLLVVGGPTHAFSLSRPATRQDAVRQGADPAGAATGLREWLSSVAVPKDATVRVAVFDTRVATVSWLPRAGASTAARLARRRGLRRLGRPEGFSVEGVRGPIADGELARAAAWGRHLAGLHAGPTADAGRRS